MVQLEPNLTLTVKHLATCGAVLSAEQQAALDHSLVIKRVEAGLKTLVLWGKILARNGKDYLVAEGYNDALLKDGAVVFEAKYYYSQDGVKWLDLQANEPDTSVRALKVRQQLRGDPSQVYPIEEKDLAAEAKPLEEGEDPPKPLVFEITELQVLRARIDEINNKCGVVPTGAMILDARNHLVINKLFSGKQYPEKLESYQHRTTPPGGPTLANDLRGVWAVQYEPFKSIAICKSMLFPGYSFYYNGYDNTWGSLYVGDGNRNNDLIFML